MPKDLVADEKHTSLKGEKIYGATTVGGGCLLGASVSQSASEEALTEAYGKFADEAKNVDPEYQVEAVKRNRGSSLFLTLTYSLGIKTL